MPIPECDILKVANLTYHMREHILLVLMAPRSDLQGPRLYRLIIQTRDIGPWNQYFDAYLDRRARCYAIQDKAPGTKVHAGSLDGKRLAEDYYMPACSNNGVKQCTGIPKRGSDACN